MGRSWDRRGERSGENWSRTKSDVYLRNPSHVTRTGLETGIPDQINVFHTTWTRSLGRGGAEGGFIYPAPQGGYMGCPLFRWDTQKSKGIPQYAGPTRIYPPRNRAKCLMKMLKPGVSDYYSRTPFKPCIRPWKPLKPLWTMSLRISALPVNNSKLMRIYTTGIRRVSKVYVLGVRNVPML